MRVSNAFGTSDSSTATVTVNAPPPAGVAPSITLQPQDQTINSGQTATLVFAASGTSPLSYQWYVGPSGATSSPVAGATSPSFTTPALTATTSYWVRVSNPFGAASSSTATVTVIADTSNPSAEDQVLVLVNQRRAAGATCGGTAYPPAGPLTMNANLQLAARLHSQDMATQNYFSHTSLDGRTFDQRIRNAGYSGSFPLGENLAAGVSNPQSLVDGWMNSPGHCANIMNGAYRSTGVGYAFSSSSTYRHYWTQTFGGSYAGRFACGTSNFELRSFKLRTAQNLRNPGTSEPRNPVRTSERYRNLAGTRRTANSGTIPGTPEPVELRNVRNLAELEDGTRNPIVSPNASRSLADARHSLSPLTIRARLDV